MVHPLPPAVSASPGVGTPRHWVRSFDLVRSAAILLVVFAHGRLLLPESLRGNYWFAPAHWGIEFFFALSGYLITAQAVQLILSPDRHTGRNFFMRRFLRTLPLYWLVVVITGLIARAGAAEIGANLLFLPTLPLAPHGPHGLVPVAWSLAIEEISYLLIGLTAVVVRNGIRRDAESPHPADPTLRACNRLALLHAVLILAMVAARHHASLQGFGFAPIKASCVLQLDALSYGGLVAIVLRHPLLNRPGTSPSALTAPATHPGPSLRILPLLALILLVPALTGLGWALRFGFLLLAADPDPATRFLPQVVFAAHSLSRLLCAGLILLAAMVPLNAVMHRERLRWHVIVDVPAFSSYSIYLLHLPLAAWMLALGSPTTAGLPFLAYLLLSISLGWWMYRLIEVPLLSLRKRFRDRPTPPPMASLRPQLQAHGPSANPPS